MQEIQFKQTEVGVIPESWPMRTIGELCWVKNGKTNSQDAVPNGNFPLFDRSLKIKKSKKYLFNCNAIIIPGEGKEFIPRYFEGKFDLHQRAYAISNSENRNDLKFIYYWMSLNRNYLKKIAVGTTVRSLRLNHLTNFPIALPDLVEQKRISKILSDLDSKIEINHKINQTLERIAQTIFKHWFVDYDFPDNNGKPYRSSGGIMIYNDELNKKIPKDWHADILENKINLEKGLSYKGAGLSESGIPLVNLGTFVPRQGFKYNGLKFYKGDYKTRHLIKPGDLVIANTDITQRREVLGSPAIVPSNLHSKKILFTHHVYAIRNKGNISNIFLFYLLQLNEYRERVKGFATGTTVLALPREAILNFAFAVPPNNILKSFVNQIQTIKNKLDHNVNENTTLVKIKNNILPKLMSGKIRVPTEI